MITGTTDGVRLYKQYANQMAADTSRDLVPVGGKSDDATYYLLYNENNSSIQPQTHRWRQQLIPHAYRENAAQTQGNKSAIRLFLRPPRDKRRFLAQQLVGLTKRGDWPVSHASVSTIWHQFGTTTKHPIKAL